MATGLFARRRYPVLWMQGTRWLYRVHLHNRWVMIIFSCKDTAQQVLMSICVVCVCACVDKLKFYLLTAIKVIAESQNVPECMQNVSECSRMLRIYAKFSRMFIQNVPECTQNVPECSSMVHRLAWRSMSLHAVPWAYMKFHELASTFMSLHPMQFHGLLCSSFLCLRSSQELCSACMFTSKTSPAMLAKQNWLK